MSTPYDFLSGSAELGDRPAMTGVRDPNIERTEKIGGARRAVERGAEISVLDLLPDQRILRARYHQNFTPDAVAAFTNIQMGLMQLRRGFVIHSLRSYVCVENVAQALGGAMTAGTNVFTVPNLQFANRAFDYDPCSHEHDFAPGTSSRDRTLFLPYGQPIEADAMLQVNLQLWSTPGAAAYEVRACIWVAVANIESVRLA